MVPPINILLSSLLIYLFASAPSIYAFNKPQVRVTTTFAEFHARIMDQWGNGGGKFVKISRDSQHPFQGRTFGGAKRKEIRGTRAFGSGYPYGANDTTTVAGRPFPFGTWPLWWDQNYMGSDEYGPRLDAIRPGGMLVTVPLQTTTEHFNVTEQEVYHAIGDKESISLLMISYVTWCHVEPAWPSRFDPARPDSTTRLENVIQYYRASSFALSTPAYNNSLARSALSNATEGSPLPAAIEYSSFRRCIDDVTSKALAILNKPPGLTPKDKFILALIFGGIFIISGAIYVVLITGYSLYLLRSSICGHIMDRYREWQARQERQRKLREMQVQARKASLVYERYP